MAGIDNGKVRRDVRDFGSTNTASRRRWPSLTRIHLQQAARLFVDMPVKYRSFEEAFPDLPLVDA